MENIDIKKIDQQYPLVGNDVDGRIVRKNIDNTSSIGASLTDYVILKGIREVPMSDFYVTGKHYSVEGSNRIDKLKNAIALSNEISPLIVVVDREGPYVLEGSTRLSALKLLNAKSFPALVVIDTEYD